MKAEVTEAAGHSRGKSGVGERTCGLSFPECSRKDLLKDKGTIMEAPGNSLRLQMTIR